MNEMLTRQDPPPMLDRIRRALDGELPPPPIAPFSKSFLTWGNERYIIANGTLISICNQRGKMCNPACISFAAASLRLEEIQGKSVIEVGSLNVNGSVRPVVESLGPKEYIGVDLRMGPGVDQICDATDILERFGANSFDVLIATELLEHARHWQWVISNFKNVLRPNGLILITTRSYGFAYHGFPYDFWRYELSDMEQIFSDFIIESLEPDSIEAGVFIKARKPVMFFEKDLTNYLLYSIIKGRRVLRLTHFDVYLFRMQNILKDLSLSQTRLFRR